jgi:hypothetical protein
MHSFIHSAIGILLRPAAPRLIAGFLRLGGRGRCVVAIIRHADRTPKQKMKLKLVLGGPCQVLAGPSPVLMETWRSDLTSILCRSCSIS